jgi:hypothetical protein
MNKDIIHVAKVATAAQPNVSGEKMGVRMAARP